MTSILTMRISCKVDVHDQYYNMAEKLNPYNTLLISLNVYLLNLILNPILNLFVVAQTVRNYHLWGYLHLIFSQDGNFHGPFEYASIDVMEKQFVVVGIAEEVAKKNNHSKL